MRYQLVGEDWLPAHDAKSEFGATLSELVKLEEEGRIRVRTLTNPHNDKKFKVYAVQDLEELFEWKERVRVDTDR